MPRFRLRSQQFCALSKELRYQSWLHTVAPDLHTDLAEHLKNSRSCNANSIKMSEIQNKLEQRNLIDQLIRFLRKEFPHTVEEVILPTATPMVSTSRQLTEAMKTEVFAYYRPALLTFPQKLILENEDPEALRRDVLAFISGRVGTDYIIIGQRAYVEYFKLKYGKESEMVKATEREIYMYRVKHDLSQTTRQLSASKI